MSAGNDRESWLSGQGETLWHNLCDLQRLLQFQQSLGITGYPLTAEVRHFLASAPGKGSPAMAPRPGTPARPETTGAGMSAALLLAAVAEEIDRCAICPLNASRLGTVPGRGAVGSRLMVVGDWSGQEPACNPAILFGPEEDAMLEKMMAAIGLDREAVYVTNILKCCPGGIPAGQECWRSCFSFLEREIAAVRPQVICAMGDLAASLLVGSREPLFRLRGQFSSYRYQSSPAIPIMPTFHPRYLLRHPELKKAAWKDLLAIRQRLDQVAGSPRPGEEKERAWK